MLTQDETGVKKLKDLKYLADKGMISSLYKTCENLDIKSSSNALSKLEILKKDDKGLYRWGDREPDLKLLGEIVSKRRDISREASRRKHDRDRKQKLKDKRDARFSEQPTKPKPEPEPEQESKVFMPTRHELNNAMEQLKKIKQDFIGFKKVSIGRHFSKSYNQPYQFVLALKELKILEGRRVRGDGRKNEYIWAAGEPTFIMGRQIIEKAESIRREQISGERKETKIEPYTESEKISAVKGALKMTDFDIDIEDQELGKLIEIVEYISDNERDAKLSELIKITE